MPRKSDLRRAEQTILAALRSKHAGRRKKAGGIVTDIFSRLFASSPAEVLSYLPDLRNEAELAEPLRDEAELVRRVMPILERSVPSGFFLLLRLLHPAWTNGGDKLFDRAPPFEELKPKLLAALDSGQIDFDGAVAILIGRYGPDAQSVLALLLRKLRKERTNCSLAAGLTWAVYQIGGLRRSVKMVLLKVAREKDSCPHARPIARMILGMNRISLRTGEEYR